MQSLKPGKIPGPDIIPCELYTHGGQNLKTHLITLFLWIWETGDVPSDFKDANTVTIFKKGDRMNCGNYQASSS